MIGFVSLCTVRISREGYNLFSLKMDNGLDLFKKKNGDHDKVLE